MFDVYYQQSDSVVDLIFLIDMVLQFFTTYVRRTPRGTGQEAVDPPQTIPASSIIIYL